MVAKALRLACALACLQASGAQAQEVASEAAARAQRDAANPLRMIIEASKLKPRQKAAVEPETVVVATKPAPAPAAKPPTPATKPVAPRTDNAAPTAAEPVRVEAAPESAVAETPTPGDAAPAPAPVVAKTEAPAAAPSAEPRDAEASPAQPAEVPPATQVALAAPTAAPAVAAATPSAHRVALKLVDYVEPALPERVRRRLQANGEVVLAFTVNADGSVADLAVQSASDRALEAVALDAVRQWRYQPIAAPQAHAVQLVFKLRE